MPRRTTPPRSGAVRDGRASRVRLTARSAELERVSEMLATLRDGRGAITVVEGRAGFGKSRLLQEAAAVVRQRWGKRDKLELYELRHACATLLMERGLPPHVVANQLGHTDGGALVQRLYGHPAERGMRDQVRLAFAGWGAEREQGRDASPGNSGFRTLCNPPSPLSIPRPRAASARTRCRRAAGRAPCRGSRPATVATPVAARCRRRTAPRRRRRWRGCTCRRSS